MAWEARLGFLRKSGEGRGERKKAQQSLLQECPGKQASSQNRAPSWMRQAPPVRSGSFCATIPMRRRKETARGGTCSSLTHRVMALENTTIICYTVAGYKFVPRIFTVFSSRLPQLPFLQSRSL